MSKKKKKYSMKLNQLSDIPMGMPQHPADHPVDNLTTRGQVPLGQSGESPMSPISQDPSHTGNL